MSSLSYGLVQGPHQSSLFPDEMLIDGDLYFTGISQS